MTTQNKNEVLGAIQETMVEIQGILAKSGYEMHKDDQAQGDDMPPPAEEGAPAEAAPEQAPPAAEGAPAEGAPAEGQGHEDPAAALAEQAKSLSDEELDHMLEALMGEKQARAAQAEGGEGAPAPAEAAPEQAPPAPTEEPAEKSMKSEFASLAKSMTGIADAVKTLTTEVAGIKAAAKTAPAKVTAKPAVANVKHAQVLEKSAPVKKRLAKSDTMTFLEGELRKGNKLINSTVIAEANLVKTDGELAQFQDRMTLEGLSFPEGK